MIEDVYLLALHEPYESPQHPVAINATIVHAMTLLHQMVPQPDGGRMYRCLTEFPGRTSGDVVPLSTLTFELDGGRLWSQVADWERVVDAVVRLSRINGCDAMPLGLSSLAAALLGGGPNTVLELRDLDGSRSQAGPAERREQVDEMRGHVQRFAAEGPFWPGDDLVVPPREPRALPYRPYATPDRAPQAVRAPVVRRRGLRRPG